MVKSAKRVLKIAEFLASQRNGATLIEIGRSLDIPASSCHSIINTMVAMGYLYRESGSKLYHLTRKWVQLAIVIDTDLIERADPWMDEIFRITGESISLAVLDGENVLFIHKKTSHERLRIVNPIGTRFPVHATALGKSIMACCDDDKLKVWLDGKILSPITPHTITSNSDLFKCLKKVREEGIAEDWEESTIGVIAIAACIRDNTNNPAGALSVAVPKFRANDDLYWENLKRMIKVGAEMVSLDIGFRGLQEAIPLDRLKELWTYQEHREF
jgi:DNA-binding IclR family transcriptional regulator